MDNAIREWFDKMYDYVAIGNLNMFVMYDSSTLLYGYEHYDKDNQAAYKYKKPINSMLHVKLEDVYPVLQKALADDKNLKFARLGKDTSLKTSLGIRIRFADEGMSQTNKMIALVNAKQKCLDVLLKAKGKPVVDNDKPVSRIKGEKKMNDFSLTNLKDAFINKVTHLDRKTVMIISIIALVLLIAGKYTTIKDIIKGIKDKIARSKNYKAMVEDGTNAVNGLKKIIGIKNKDVNNEI